MDKAWMQSPDGEVREVPVNELTPYMVEGWKQCAPPDSKPAGKQEDLDDASNTVE